MLIIDMQNAFIEEASPLCIKGARITIPNCVRALDAARRKGIPVIYIKRQYREDGSDVEITRRELWERGGKPLTPGSTGPLGEEYPAELKPEAGDYEIIKPRWSAFFETELDILLRRLEVGTVILTGTTTPNCIRTTCYDANALNYNVVIIEDCTSSVTTEIQKANIEDMARMGAIITTVEEFASCR
ncbi:MAG: cysteine hydrolase [Clostridiales bacterium]|nr:cysteine hydrolase [Candidatus Crickella merdequi]